MTTFAQGQKFQPGSKPPKNLVYLNSKWHGEVTSSATGMAVSPSRVITVYHAGQNLEPILLKSESKEEKKGKVIAGDPEHDYLVLEFDGEPFKGADPVKVGPPVFVGQHIYCWGNANGQGPLYREFVVAKLEENYVVVDRNFIHGESGSPCYNFSEQLVGMVSSGLRADHTDVTLDNANDELGIFIPVEFFKQHIPLPAQESDRKP